jgi:hypothetical protein
MHSSSYKEASQKGVGPGALLIKIKDHGKTFMKRVIVRRLRVHFYK